jgi:hypothetical protein
VEVVEMSRWEIGWDSLVAVGTLLLAMVTAGLALSTRALAEASKADLRAQWRPVILPALDPPSRRAITYDRGLLRVRIQNGGQGAALYIRTTIDPLGISPEHWSLGALAAGDEQELRFRTEQINSAIQLLFDYRDLADHAYSTSITVDLVDQDLRFYDVRLFDYPITPLGDAIYPQSGLSDVRRQPHRGLWARLRGR